MRSYSGCLTCRRRKLKCDEQKPQCGQCRKGSRECVFSERVIFRDGQGQPLSTDGPTNWGYEETQRWLPVPPRLTFINIDDPYEDEFDVGPTLYDVPEHRPHFPYDLDGGFDLVHLTCPNESHAHGDRSDPSPVPSHSSGGDVNNDDTASTFDDPEKQAQDYLLTLHLLKKFKEGPGYWMDVFDTGAYFSHRVPVMAASKPLLKSAACAYAAKYLHHIQTRLKNNDPCPRNDGSHPPYIPRDVDWQYQAAKHYDRALAHLKSAIQLRRFETNGADREELFASIAIMCAHELMTAPGTAWRAHLSALPLFTSATPQEQTEGSGLLHHSPITIPRAAISGPIFWALARQDLLCAFLSETQTRLDLDDIRLWQNAGLCKDMTARLISSSSPRWSELISGVGDVHTAADVEEDTRSNEIHWLLGKIANFISSGDALHPEAYALPAEERPPIGVTQGELLERWKSLTRELQRWKSTLPPSFQPSARTSMAAYPSDSSDSTGSHLSGFEQIWYDAPICAAAMQSYHMAAILLLVNQPQESTAVRSTVSLRLQAYRQGEREALLHARELCGTCLAGPPDPVRIHSVQALSVAGQVFEKPEDLQVVLELLEGIERDLGWTTFHHRSRLRDLLQGRKNGRLKWLFM